MKSFKYRPLRWNMYSHTALSVLQKPHTIHVNASVGMGMCNSSIHMYVYMSCKTTILSLSFLHLKCRARYSAVCMAYTHLATPNSGNYMYITEDWM